MDIAECVSKSSENEVSKELIVSHADNLRALAEFERLASFSRSATIPRSTRFPPCSHPPSTTSTLPSDSYLTTTPPDEFKAASSKILHTNGEG